MVGQITLLRLQRAGTTTNYTQGVATLYPGLCAFALTARQLPTWTSELGYSIFAHQTLHTIIQVLLYVQICNSREPYNDNFEAKILIFSDDVSLDLRPMLYACTSWGGMAERAEVACTYVYRICGWTWCNYKVEDGWKACRECIKIHFPFLDCVYKRNIFKCQYVWWNSSLVTFWKSVWPLLCSLFDSV